jgi:hypothetical protein
VSPLERIERADRSLGFAEVALALVSMFVFLARRRLKKAAVLVGVDQELTLTLEQEVARLRTQLDGALDHIHEQAGDQGGSIDNQGSGASIDIQGSEAGEALDIKGSSQPDQA